jgi:hypothetical protein
LLLLLLLKLLRVLRNITTMRVLPDRPVDVAHSAEKRAVDVVLHFALVDEGFDHVAAFGKAGDERA